MVGWLVGWLCGWCSTLFYAGKTFAPSLMVNTRTGLPSHISPPSTQDDQDDKDDDDQKADKEEEEEQNIQDFLQDRYIGMFERLVAAVEGVDGVLGFEVSLGRLLGFDREAGIEIGVLTLCIAWLVGWLSRGLKS